MKTALYLIVTNGYDTVIPLPEQFRRGIDCFLFTDDAELTCDGFTTVVIPKTDDPNRQQRALKLLIPEQLHEYDRVIYLDANIQVLRPLNQFLAHHRGNISMMQHPKRICVYAEGFACIDLNKANPGDVKAQLKKYIDEGIKPGSGMYQTGMMIRDKNDEVANFCQIWHDELQQGTHRDQLSVIAARDRAGIKINAIPYNAFSQFFKIHPHKPKITPIIHYLQPFAVDKNIGREYNAAIERLQANDDDFVVITDYDAMFTTPDYGRQISAVLNKYGNDYMLFGAMTNRIRSQHQRIDGMFEETDIKVHLLKGKEVEQKDWCKVEPCNGVAGFFMCFKVSTWRKIKFNEDSIRFDTEFSQAVIKHRGKIGLMKGVYLFHCYRMLAADPFNEFEHLTNK